MLQIPPTLLFYQINSLLPMASLLGGQQPQGQTDEASQNSKKGLGGVLGGVTDTVGGVTNTVGDTVSGATGAAPGPVKDVGGSVGGTVKDVGGGNA